ASCTNAKTGGHTRQDRKVGGLRLRGDRRRRAGRDRKDPSSMGRGNECRSHPKEFVHRHVGWPVIAGGPGYAAILAAENAYFGSDIEQVAVGGMDDEGIDGSTWQIARDIAPGGSVIGASPHVPAAKATKGGVHRARAGRRHSQARAVTARQVG